MTRKAIEFFKFQRKIFCDDYLKICPCPKDSVAYQVTLKEKEFYDMAIKALERSTKMGYWIIERDPNTGKDMSYHCSECYNRTGHFVTSCDNYCPECGTKMHLQPIEEGEEV